MTKQPPLAPERMRAPLPQSEINRRLWRIYEMALAAAARYEREQAAQQAQDGQPNPSASER